MSDLEAARIKGNDAKLLLNNPLLKEIFSKIEERMNANILSCNLDDKDTMLRVVLGRQIFEGFKREFYRIIQDGQVAEFRLAEAEKQKRSVFRR